MSNNLRDAINDVRGIPVKQPDGSFKWVAPENYGGFPLPHEHVWQPSGWCGRCNSQKSETA